MFYTYHNHWNREVRPKLEICPEWFGKEGVLVNSSSIYQFWVWLVFRFLVHIDPEMFFKVAFYKSTPIFECYFSRNSWKSPIIKTIFTGLF